MVAADKPAIVAKPSLDMIVVENSERNRCFTNSARTDESNWDEVLYQVDHPPDQLFASEESPWWQRRGFSRHAEFECQTMGLSVVQIADLVRVWAMVRGYFETTRL